MDFREVLSGMEHRNIGHEVDPYLEAASICRKRPPTAWVAGASGFEGWRMAGNVYSSRETLAAALGTDIPGIRGAMMKAASVPAAVEKVDLPDEYGKVSASELPIPTYFANDGGPYITSGIVHASHDGKSNLSFHRMMHLGDGRFAARVVPRHLNSLLTEARTHGEELDAVVSIGADPFSLLAASTSAPFGQDELEIASSLRMDALGSPLRVMKVSERDPVSPLGSEVVMVGRFINERAPEGPFVDITSTYDRAGMDPGEPVFEVDEVLVRRDPIMHVLLPGGLEHYLLMGIPKEPAIWKAVSMVVPSVRDVRLTEGGCCWLHGVVSIIPGKQGDAKNAITAAFSGHPSMKRVIVVDSDIDIFDDEQVEWALATRFQADRDLLVVEGARGSTLDPSVYRSDGSTAKLGMDATMPLGDEERFRKVE